MWWTVCSLTQELVNICSSTEDKDDVLKPGEKTENYCKHFVLNAVLYICTDLANNGSSI